MPGRSRPRRSAPLTARTADRHVLYQQSVQEVGHEIDFVDRTFRRLKGRTASLLREDFSGTANSSCEWVRRRKSNRAVAVDIDRAVQEWGRAHNLAALEPAARERVRLLNRDVRRPGAGGLGVDVVLAMNFSYWIFKTRPALRGYFESVRRSLARDGVFFLDFFGGYESMKEQREKRRVRSYRYVWEQHSYNPLTGEMTCYIHFEFADGSKLRRAFEYHWRLWTLPEIKEILEEAGFARVLVYLEGEDAKGQGDGVFRPRTVGPADPAFLAFITAEK